MMMMLLLLSALCCLLMTKMSVAMATVTMMIMLMMMMILNMFMITVATATARVKKATVAVMYTTTMTTMMTTIAMMNVTVMAREATPLNPETEGHKMGGHTRIQLGLVNKRRTFGTPCRFPSSVAKWFVNTFQTTMPNATHMPKLGDIHKTEPCSVGDTSQTLINI